MLTKHKTIAPIYNIMDKGILFSTTMNEQTKKKKEESFRCNKPYDIYLEITWDLSVRCGFVFHVINVVIVDWKQQQQQKVVCEFFLMDFSYRFHIQNTLLLNDKQVEWRRKCFPIQLLSSWVFPQSFTIIHCKRAQVMTPSSYLCAHQTKWFSFIVKYLVLVTEIYICIDKISKHL